MLPRVPFEDGDPDFEISVQDVSDPRSIINLVTLDLARAIGNIPTDLLAMSEEMLKQEFKARDYKPSITENRLRHAFWREYNIVQATRRKTIRMGQVLAGCCHANFFRKHIMSDPHKLAWILCPPSEYMKSLEEALMFGIDQLRDILEMPLTDPMGIVDSKLAATKLEIVRMIDMRVKGAVIQKTQNLHATVPASQLAPPDESASESLEKINERLRDLERESTKFENQTGGTPPASSEVRQVDVSEVLPKEHT